MERWLVTGAAGFIGSHMVEELLKRGYAVRGLDNYATGKRENVDDAVACAGRTDSAKSFEMIEGDITDAAACALACCDVDRVVHLAALGSVPRSMANPTATFDSNAQGFANMITAAKDAGVRRFVYASSSSVYGDEPNLPKVEGRTGLPLSPYALSKWMNEEAAELYTRVFGMECIGMRYFNVFGPRQDPEGAYAAVIPRWFTALQHGERPAIYGDGSTSRDFCYVSNVVSANILAATTENTDAFGQAFNIACERRTTLNELFAMIREIVGANPNLEPVYEDFRPGDVQHSLASVDKARKLLGYEPAVYVREGLERAAGWYLRD